MGRSNRRAGRGHVLFALTLLFAVTARPASAQTVRGRVIDDESRQPIRGVVVALLDANERVIDDTQTGDDGFFRLRSDRAGEFEVRVQHPGYAVQSRKVKLETGETTLPAFVLKSEVVQLDSVEVEADARRADPFASRARSLHVVAGSRMAAAERRGADLVSLFRDMSGVRVRQWMDRNGKRHTCVESTRSMRSMREQICDPLPFVIDGVVIDTASARQMLQNLSVQDWESVEFVPPIEAGMRYGLQGSATGVIVLWSRGRGPWASKERDGRDGGED